MRNNKKKNVVRQKSYDFFCLDFVFETWNKNLKNYKNFRNENESKCDMRKVIMCGN